MIRFLLKGEYVWPSVRIVEPSTPEDFRLSATSHLWLRMDMAIKGMTQTTLSWRWTRDHEYPVFFYGLKGSDPRYRFVHFGYTLEDGTSGFITHTNMILGEGLFIPYPP
jgi:hypothetical protein